jgi:hypothetical protein
MTRIEQATRRLEEAVLRLETAAQILDHIDHDGVRGADEDPADAARADQVAARLDAVIGRLDRVLEG